MSKLPQLSDTDLLESNQEDSWTHAMYGRVRYYFRCTRLHSIPGYDSATFVKFNTYPKFGPEASVLMQQVADEVKSHFELPSSKVKGIVNELYGHGTIQDWIWNKGSLDTVGLSSWCTEENCIQLIKTRYYDFVMNNTDRRGTNTLVTTNNDIWSIDESPRFIVKKPYMLGSRLKSILDTWYHRDKFNVREYIMRVQDRREEIIGILDSVPWDVEGMIPDIKFRLFVLPKFKEGCFYVS